MLVISSIPVGEMQTNCYVVWDEHTLETVVIDPGDSGDTINQFLLEKQLCLQVVIATHGHFDHLLGVLEVAAAWEVPFAAHGEDLFLIKGAQKSAQYHLKHAVDPIPNPTHILKDKDSISIGNEALTVLHTPGHTPGSICLVHDEAIFTGDTLFIDQPPARTDFSYSDASQLRNSLQKLSEVFGKDHPNHSKRLVFPGHGASGYPDTKSIGMFPD